ncbi:MAG: hypothetical protein AABM29_02405 [Actinomycetota bacterium]
MTRKGQIRAAALCAVGSVGILAAGFPAAAPAKKPITGKLSKPGYTVFALAKSGQAKSIQPKGRKFKLRPPAKRVTLQLRAKDGTYAGPIVVGTKKKRKRAILGIKAGAKLGKVKVKAGKGYAKVKRTLPGKFQDAKRKARAKKGIPIGAGKFGRVRSKKTGGGAPGDRDLDGVPDPLDVDDDGDLILDNLDVSTGGGARASQGCGPNNFYCQPIASSLNLCCGLDQTVNVSALALAGLTPGEIQQQADTALRSSGALRFSPLTEPEELDCGGEPDPNNPDGWSGGLSYCTRGGTGLASAGGPGLSFPGPPPPNATFDTDGDGFGTMPTPSFIAPRATTAEIKTGDWMNQVVTSDGTETKSPAMLNFVFVTSPALVFYSDTAGNCAKASGTPGNCATEFSYPVAGDGPGTVNNGLPVSAGSDGNVVVTLTFWRPQRQPIEGEACLFNTPPCAWVDIGHLTYATAAPNGCSQDTLSSTDLTTPTLPLLGTGGLFDPALDQESSPGNTFTYTLKLSQCLAENGNSSSFDEPGEEQPLRFSGTAGATDFAQLTVFFQRQ